MTRSTNTNASVRNQEFRLVLEEGCVGVQLKHGLCLFDFNDAALLAKYCWTSWEMQVEYRHTIYACSATSGRAQRMHRLLLNAPPSIQVDHRNGNGLDNRRFNLRLATDSQNLANRPGWTKATASRFKGVTWHGDRRKWVAQIKVKRQHHYLGIFTDEVEAARTYDKAALLYFGSFAWLNFPDN